MRFYAGLLFASLTLANQPCPSGWSRGIDLNGNADPTQQSECYVSAGAAQVTSCNGANNVVEMTTKISTELISNPPDGFVLKGLYYERTFAASELDATSANGYLTLKTQVILPTARKSSLQKIYIGVNTIVNFACKYNMGDKEVTKKMTVSGEDVNLNRVAEGVLEFDIDFIGDSDMAIGERATFSITPATPDLIYARAKQCTISKLDKNDEQMSDMSVFLIGEDKAYCTNGFLGFKTTEGFGSRQVQKYEFSAFKWNTDVGSAETESHALTCVVEMSLSPFDSVIPAPCVYNDDGTLRRR
jgi:hypothetical protein